MDNSINKEEIKSATWAQIKPKLFEILITALLSAALAFIQSLIANHSISDVPTANPEIAGGIGAGIRTFWISIKRPFC